MPTINKKSDPVDGGEVGDKEPTQDPLEALLARLSSRLSNGDESIEEVFKRLNRVIRRSSEDDDDDEDVLLDRGKLRGRSARELRKMSDKHLIHRLQEHGMLVRRFFCKEPDGDALLPFSVFCAQSINGELFSGEVIHCALRHGVMLTMKVESFTGVALEVMVGDLEEDGYLPIE